MPMMHPVRLSRLRWAVRLVLVLGVAASVAGNILHAADNPISQTIAAWPPLALLLTVELISRVPVHRRSLAAVRLLTTAVIATIAAWVSYWHMVGVVARYGETGAAPYLLPLSVDGLVVVASVCLVELGGRIRGAAPATVDSPADNAPDRPADTPEDQADRPADTTAPVRVRRPRVRSVRSAVPGVSAGAAARIAAAMSATPGAGRKAIATAAGVSTKTVQRWVNGQPATA